MHALRMSVPSLFGTRPVDGVGLPSHSRLGMIHSAPRYRSLLCSPEIRILNLYNKQLAQLELVRATAQSRLVEVLALC